MSWVQVPVLRKTILYVGGPGAQGEEPRDLFKYLESFMDTKKTKLTVYLTPRSVSSLQDMASLTDKSMTITVNHAIQFWAILNLERAAGADLWIVHTEPSRRPWWLWLLGPFALLFKTSKRKIIKLDWD